MRFTCALLLIGTLVTVSPALAQSRTDGTEIVRTAVSCRALNMRGTLRALLRNAGLGYEVRGDAPDVPVSLDLRNVPLQDAIGILVRHAQFSVLGVQVTQQGGIYAIASPAPAAAGAVRPPALPAADPTGLLLQKRSIKVTGLHLAEALEQYFDAADSSFGIDPDVPDAIISALPDEPTTLWCGIQRVLAAARTTCGELYVARIGEIYVIARNSGQSVEPTIRARRNEKEQEVHLILRDMPLRVAIVALFRGSGYLCAIDPDVPNVPVTTEIREVGLSRALQTLLNTARKQVPGLTFSKG